MDIIKGFMFSAVASICWMAPTDASAFETCYVQQGTKTECSSRSVTSSDVQYASANEVLPVVVTNQNGTPYGPSTWMELYDGSASSFMFTLSTIRRSYTTSARSWSSTAIW